MVNAVARGAAAARREGIGPRALLSRTTNHRTHCQEVRHSFASRPDEASVTHIAGSRTLTEPAALTQSSEPWRWNPFQPQQWLWRQQSPYDLSLTTAQFPMCDCLLPSRRQGATTQWRKITPAHGTHMAHARPSQQRRFDREDGTNSNTDGRAQRVREATCSEHATAGSAQPQTGRPPKPH